MKVPISWLREFVDVPGDPESLAEMLTASGMKVEKIQRYGDGIEDIVVGEVSSVKPHPDADKLCVVQVRTGCMDLGVVCGASNFGVGDKVPVAQPGSHVPGLGEITRRKFRGVVSEGMLCSAAELGLGDDHTGIMILGEDSVVGTDVGDALGLPEAVLELEINPNRPDAMGMIGIAREVAACTGSRLKDLSALFQYQAAGPPVSERVQVEVADPQGCPRYAARVIEGIGHAQSPTWAQRRLTMCGVRPISAVVDATNYVLLATGHPMHAFDMAKVAGRRIVVRRATQGERITTIDGVERELDLTDVVIADESQPIALAGIMGGQGSEVTEDSDAVILETATFDPRSIFRTSRRHGLRSEASARFERGVDVGGVDAASKLAARLILEWAGGSAAQGSVDVYPQPVEPQLLHLRPERARQVLGAPLSDEQMVEALDRLGLDPRAEGERIAVTVPTYRVDLAGEEDLVEEVARVTGYDRIPATLPPGRSRAGSLSPEERRTRRLKRALIGSGLFEARTSSLVSAQDLELIGHHPDAATKVANPLTQDEALLRTSLLPGLVRSAVINLSRRHGDVRLFEAGLSFHPNGVEAPTERLRLGLAIGGAIPQQWHSPARPTDFFDMKGAVEVALQSLRVTGVRFVPHSGYPFHPARAAKLLSSDGKELGVFGEVDDSFARKADVAFVLSLGELDLDALIDMGGKPGTAAQIGKYPPTLLDLAVALPEGVASADVIATARAAGGPLLESVRIIDVYRGEQVGPGRKSLAFSLTFRSLERTLNENEAIEARDAIAAAIGKEHQGVVRA
ncbi:MAG: phenylalanine--tRNA ligase subunit beta [Actinomycetota bacterium]